MNYNSLLSKDYKLKKTNGRKNLMFHQDNSQNNGLGSMQANMNRQKKYNFKLGLIGIMTVSSALFSYGLYFSSHDSQAIADTEIQTQQANNEDAKSQQELVIQSNKSSKSVPSSALQTYRVENPIDPNQLIARQLESATSRDSAPGIAKPIQTQEKAKPVKQPIVAQSTPPNISQITQKIAAQKDWVTKVVRVRKKDSMAAIFRRHKLSAKTLHILAYKTKLGKQLTRLKPGQKIIIVTDKKNQIQSLRLQKSLTESILLTRDYRYKKPSFTSSIEKIEAEKSNPQLVITPRVKPDRPTTKLVAKSTTPNVQPKTTQRKVVHSTKSGKNTTPKNIPIINKVATSRTVTVKKGDTLAAIFKRNGLNKTVLHYLVRSGKYGKQLTRIRPGQKFIFGFDQSKQLVSLQLQKNRIESLVFQKDLKNSDKKPTYIAYTEQKEVEIRTQFINGTIQGSFFTSAKSAGMSDAMAMKLAHLFGWDIDFALNIRSGDSFSVLFEEKYLEGEKIANGDIVVAEFINQGESFQAIRYTDAGGRTDYYTPEGYSLRKAFLRTPVAFSRISSRFSLGRRHPVLNRIRAHKGVDYAAPRGTPIKATGNGKVVFKGRKGGYGKVVQIRHANKYETVYAHMSSFNRKVKRGGRVKQGQIIGYVGSTGLATGPHLHYEFRVNGVHRNPLTVKLPNADPISKKYKNDFIKTSNTLLSKLTLEKKQQLASAE